MADGGADGGSLMNLMGRCCLVKCKGISLRGPCQSKEHRVDRNRVNQRSKKPTGWPWVVTMSGTESAMETRDLCQSQI